MKMMKCRAHFALVAIDGFVSVCYSVFRSELRDLHPSVSFDIR